MAGIELVIKIPQEAYNNVIEGGWVYCEYIYNIIESVKNGIPLPKRHGRLVDIGKIDEDRIESDNPIIYLTINGEYIEAISLEYLNSLPTIIETDKEEDQ